MINLDKSFGKNTWIALIAAIGLLLVAPTFVASGFARDVLTFTFLFAYLSIAWNILGGFAGQPSIGHAAYFGLGAYTTGALFIGFRITPWVGMLAGAALAGLFALGLGYPTFRLRSHYYILATLAVAQVVYLTFLGLEETGGPRGIVYPLLPDSFWDFQFHESRIPYYYLMAGLMIAGILVSYVIRSSKFGLNLQAIRDDEDGAQSVGINVFRHKQIASFISAAMTGIGGAFYSQFTLFIDPDSTMTVFLSADIVIPALLGGIGTTLGPVFGSFIITPLSWFIRAWTGSALHITLKSMILILVVMFMPGGVLHTVNERYIRPKVIKK